MAKKGKKNKHKKGKNSYSTKKQKKLLKKINKYKSTRDMVLDMFPRSALEIMFDNEEKILEYGDYLVKINEYLNEDTDDILLEDTNVYQQRLDKLQKKKVDDEESMILRLHELIYLQKKINKNKSYKNKAKEYDLSIASYLNDKKYKKKFLDKKKYRKNIKKIADAERKEMKEMEKLGYIKRKDVDKELNKLKINQVNKKMLNALNDAYEQKYFLD